MEKIMVAMSGGVDSSACAYILLSRGNEVCGGMLKMHDEKDIVDASAGCATTQDIIDAQNVANQLNIPFYLFDCRADFKDKVINQFINCYKCGATPNPCVDCNKNIKFPLMIEKALEKGCDKIATGHYARIEKDEKTGRFILKKAVDLTKDQSYVLYGLTQEQLSRVVFPLGDYTKEEIRKTAQESGIKTAHKSDSQDICFVPDGDYVKFIEKYTNETFEEGNFVDKNNNVLGTHKGIIRYTVGQRKGLGLALPAPMYVKSKDIKSNTVTLVSNEELFSKKLIANDINLISVEKITAPMRVKAKVRYKQAEQDATVTQTDDDTLVVEFDEPQRAISLGQAVVLYDGDTVVGGGTIAEVPEE